MSLMVKEIIILLMYAIGINLVLLGFANLGSGNICANLYQPTYNKTYNSSDTSNAELGRNSASIIDLALGRCDGLPQFIVLIFELPIIVGLLYLIRGFIGAT